MNGLEAIKASLQRTLDMLDPSQTSRWFASQHDANQARLRLEHDARYYRAQIALTPNGD